MVAGRPRPRHPAGGSLATRADAGRDDERGVTDATPRWTVPVAPRGYSMMVTGVPSGAQPYMKAATSSGWLMQPWLIGLPKLLCQ